MCLDSANGLTSNGKTISPLGASGPRNPAQIDGTVFGNEIQTYAVVAKHGTFVQLFGRKDQSSICVAPIDIAGVRSDVVRAGPNGGDLVTEIYIRNSCGNILGEPVTASPQVVIDAMHEAFRQQRETQMSYLDSVRMPSVLPSDADLRHMAEIQTEAVKKVIDGYADDWKNGKKPGDDGDGHDDAN